jgi:hypothetical protein
MKVGEIQKKIGVSASSYSAFLAQNGPSKGMESNTFLGAAEFFKRRELAGLKMPRARKVKTEASANNVKPTKTKSTKSKDAAEHDVSSIELDGEDKAPIPVFETCDDVRIKINRFMRETASTSQAGFVRLITAALPATANIAAPSARQLTTFLSKHGPLAGVESPIFYASYVFFEKLRVKEGKPKSKKRLEMEEHHGKDGMELSDACSQPMWLRYDETMTVDHHGIVNIVRM